MKNTPELIPDHRSKEGKEKVDNALTFVPHTHKEEPPVYNSTSVTPVLNMTIIEPKEEPRSWEGWDDLRIKLRTASSYEREALVYKFVSTREKEVREETLAWLWTIMHGWGMGHVPMKKTLGKIMDYISAPKTEIR